VQRDGTLAINGAELYYEMRGSGHPLVLAHAGIGDSRMWADQMDAFAEHYTVIRYDHRGWGRSSAPAGPVAFHEDLYGVIRGLGVDRAHVLGISMAGTFAIDGALTHPDAVSALVLVGSWLSGYQGQSSDAERTVWQAFSAALEAGDLDRANQIEVDLKLAGIYRAPDRVDPRVRQRLLAMHRESFDRQAEKERMAPWLHAEPPAVGRLGEIAAPTLVLYGDLDVPDVPIIANKLASEIRGAQLRVLHGTAHVPNMELPEEFNRETLAFLGSVKVS
jgi:3-oxoadipate enol-lactonase